jgi:hypothetical protein
MSVDLRFQRANAAFAEGRWEEAEQGYRALIPDHPLGAWNNLASLYAALGRDGAAEDAFAHAVRADPAALGPRYGLAQAHLRTGRFETGWRLYETRRGLPGLNVPNPRPGYPEWRGEDLAGRRLLVVREQGLGDQIQFARFLPELSARGAETVFLCDPPVEGLMAGLADRVVAAERGEAYPPADLWVLQLSLPLRLGLSLEGLSGAPYLAAKRSAGGGIGVKAEGSPAHPHDRHRSLPPTAAERLRALGQDLDPRATGARDLDETAQIIAGLDLVITVDTAIAHLAGALGVPVWILLGAVHTDWRWLRAREDSPWYRSARLYRQATPGDWDAVLDRVVADLA